MFGVSFTELMLIGVVALVVVGPQRLPGMMSTVGKWSNKLRRMLFDVRQQSGIDDILRAEGITGGLNEIRALRNAVRGNVSSLTQALTAGPRPVPPVAPSPTPAAPSPVVSPGSPAQTALAAESDPYANVPYDRTREYPDEGCDAYGAIPDDLWKMSRRPVPPVEPLPDDAPSPQAPSEAPLEPVSETPGAAADVAPNASEPEPKAHIETQTAETSEQPGAASPERETSEAPLSHDVSPAAQESSNATTVTSNPEPEVSRDSTEKANVS